jgi:hypothetical protein
MPEEDGTDGSSGTVQQQARVLAGQVATNAAVAAGAAAEMARAGMKQLYGSFGRGEEKYAQGCLVLIHSWLQRFGKRLQCDAKRNAMLQSVQVVKQAIAGAAFSVKCRGVTNS